MAIPVSGELAQRCQALSEGLPGAVPVPNLHLTLAFLGNINGQRRDAIDEWLQAVTGEHGPFVLPLTRCEPFPGSRGPFLALTPGSPPAPLLHLYQALLPGLPEADIRRPYRPHVTLARPGQGLPVKTGQWTLTVDRLCLYHSQTRPKGPPLYQPLATYPLEPL
ncbi:2'-5' RNA ligase family protein [Alcanivorax hongdengensis]|uniref:2'-5' RNA ligase family protein n=1 Tax=Alcanivorax hongdengensis TaxID=519051 RepID=UPI00138ADC0E|nr:2'-5' RNA ligase family protein [Alcanivorax hongdengensis]